MYLVCLRLTIQDWQQGVNGKSRQPQPRHPQQKFHLKEAHFLQPDHSADKQRQRGQHHPVFGHAQSPDQGRRIEPSGVPVKAVFKQQPQGGRRQQQVQRFAGGGGRLLPETEFQPAQGARQQNRQRAGQAAGVFPRLVPWQNLNGAGQHPHRQRGSGGGKKIQAKRHPGGGHRPQWQGKQPKQRLPRHRRPVPAHHLGRQRQAVRRHSVAQRDRVKNKGSQCGQKWQAASHVVHNTIELYSTR